MPTSDNDIVPLEMCVLPGQVALSESAWKEASRDGRAFSKQTGSSSHIVGFHWAEGRQLQRNPDSEVEDKGPGLMLGFYKRSQFSAQVIHQRQGIECVVVIPQDVMNKSVERLIDTDERVWGGLVLR